MIDQVGSHESSTTSVVLFVWETALNQHYVKWSRVRRVSNRSFASKLLRTSLPVSKTLEYDVPLGETVRSEQQDLAMSQANSGLRCF